MINNLFDNPKLKWSLLIFSIILLSLSLYLVLVPSSRPNLFQSNECISDCVLTPKTPDKPANSLLVNTFQFLPSDAVYLHKTTESRTADQTLDIVMLNNGFTNENEFLENARKLTARITTYDYFKDKKNKYNIIAVATKMDQTKYICTATSCLANAVFDLIKKYGDAGIIISNSNVWSSFAFFMPTWPNDLGFVNITNEVYKNSTGTEVMHELGHSIGKLNDEYLYVPEPAAKIEGVNCKQTCAALGESTCYQGCVYASFYRSSYNSIMRAGDSPVYDNIAKKQFNTLLAKYAPDIDNVGSTMFTISPSGTITSGDLTLNISKPNYQPQLIWVGTSTSNNNVYSSWILSYSSKAVVPLSDLLKGKKGKVYVKYWLYSYYNMTWSGEEVVVNYDFTGSISSSSQSSSSKSSITSVSSSVSSSTSTSISSVTSVSTKTRTSSSLSKVSSSTSSSTQSTVQNFTIKVLLSSLHLRSAPSVYASSVGLIYYGSIHTSNCAVYVGGSYPWWARLTNGNYVTLGYTAEAEVTEIRDSAGKIVTNYNSIPKCK